MFSRVSAALSQFIKPIASSTQKPVVHSTPAELQQRREPGQFKKFNQDGGRQEQRQEAPSAKVIPFPAPSKTASPQPPGAAISESGLSVTHSFIQLFSSLQSGRTALLRWIGARSYQSATATQRKIGKYRKGAMLDKKVE
ncbi:MAG: hypothetical protein NDJ89_02645 [Oligoflexia bacterium]|nr:hypothetical protein [Oligoflexia bacterium]